MFQNITNQYHYLPIIDACIDWDVYLTGIGVATIPPNSQYPPNGHPDMYDFQWNRGRVLPEYQIIFISQGRGVFESCATGKVEVNAGNIIILFPELWHRYKPVKEIGWRENWIGLNGEFLYRLTMRKLINPQNAILTLPDSGQIINAYSRIWNTLHSLQMNNSFILSAYAMEILALAIDAAHPADGKPAYIEATNNQVIKDRIATEALQYIWSHSHRNTSVDDVVNQLPVTRRTLERKFSRSLGHSIGAEITRCRIERAKRLLIHTSLPIGHIALAVGFSGSDRLSKVFQKQLQTTPGKFRTKFQTNK